MSNKLDSLIELSEDVADHLVGLKGSLGKLNRLIAGELGDVPQLHDSYMLAEQLAVRFDCLATTLYRMRARPTVAKRGE